MLPTLTKKSVPGKKSAFGRAMDRMREQNSKRAVRIGFVIDATASREATWEQAQQIQEKMFRALKGNSAMALRQLFFYLFQQT